MVLTLKELTEILRCRITAFRDELSRPPECVQEAWNLVDDAFQVTAKKIKEGS